MNKVRSSDGTPIAFDRSGQGPALILVTGAIAKRSDAASLAASLAPHFTVFAYDRRGRGDSGDTAPYAVDREVEDIDALIPAAGGRVFLFGHSSGAVLALETARLLPGKISKLAVYEPPFIVDDSRPPVPEDFVARLTGLAAEGRRGDAVRYYMDKGLQMPAGVLAQVEKSPRWPALEAAAPTLAYDGAIMGETMRGRPLPRRWDGVAIPTLVMDGGRSPAFMHHAAQALVDQLPNAQHRFFPDQDHGIADAVLVPVLVDFFKG